MAQTGETPQPNLRALLTSKVEVADLISFGGTLDAALQVHLLHRLRVAPTTQLRQLQEIYEAQQGSIEVLFLPFFQKLLTIFMLSIKAEQLTDSEHTSVIAVIQEQFGFSLDPAHSINEFFAQDEVNGILLELEVELEVAYQQYTKDTAPSEQPADYVEPAIPDIENTQSLVQLELLRDSWIHYQFLLYTFHWLNNKHRVSYASLNRGNTLTSAHPELHKSLSIWNHNTTPEHLYTIFQKMFERISHFIEKPRTIQERYEIYEMLKAGHFLSALVRAFRRIEQLQNTIQARRSVDHRARFAAAQARNSKQGPTLSL